MASPFLPGQAWDCPQGNNTPGNITHISNISHSWDFSQDGLPNDVGKPLIAGVSGIVTNTGLNGSLGNHNHPIYGGRNSNCGGEGTGFGYYVRISGDGANANYRWLTSHLHYTRINGQNHPYIFVKQGQYIQQGQVIGYVGNTGYSCGDHIHVHMEGSQDWNSVASSFTDIGNINGLPAPMGYSGDGMPTESISDVPNLYTSQNHTLFQIAKDVEADLSSFANMDQWTFGWHHPWTSGDYSNVYFAYTPTGYEVHRKALVYDPMNGARMPVYIHNQMSHAWLADNGPQSDAGAPIDREQAVGSDVQQYFQGAYWEWDGNVATKHYYPNQYGPGSFATSETDPGLLLRTIPKGNRAVDIRWSPIASYAFVEAFTNNGGLTEVGYPISENNAPAAVHRWYETYATQGNGSGDYIYIQNYDHGTKGNCAIVYDPKNRGNKNTETAQAGKNKAWLLEDWSWDYYRDNWGPLVLGPPISEPSGNRHDFHKGYILKNNGDPVGYDHNDQPLPEPQPLTIMDSQNTGYVVQVAGIQVANLPATLNLIPSVVEVTTYEPTTGIENSFGVNHIGSTNINLADYQVNIDVVEFTLSNDNPGIGESTIASVELRNNGASSVTMPSISLSSQDGYFNEYSQESGVVKSGPITLGAGQTYSFTFPYTPQSIDGPRSLYLKRDTGSSGASPYFGESGTNPLSIIVGNEIQGAVSVTNPYVQGNPIYAGSNTWIGATWKTGNAPLNNYRIVFEYTTSGMNNWQEADAFTINMDANDTKSYGSDNFTAPGVGSHRARISHEPLGGEKTVLKEFVFTCTEQNPGSGELTLGGDFVPYDSIYQGIPHEIKVRLQEWQNTASVFAPEVRLSVYPSARVLTDTSSALYDLDTLYNVSIPTGSNYTWTQDYTFRDNGDYQYAVRISSDGIHWSYPHSVIQFAPIVRYGFPNPYQITVLPHPDAPPALNSLLVNGNTNPSPVTNMTFSGIISDQSGNTTTAYQLQLADSTQNWNKPVWDTGKVQLQTPRVHGESLSIPYAGNPLTYDGSTYYWRIRTWNQHDYSGHWSDGASSIGMYKNIAPSATHHYYPDSSDAVFGVGESNSSTDWNTARAMLNATYAVSHSAPIMTVRCDDHAGRYRIYRVSLPFVIPNKDNKVIKDGTLTIPTGIVNTEFGVSLVSHYRTTYLPLTNTDFAISNFGTVELASRQTEVNNKLSFTLNQSGIDYLQSTPGDTVVFGLMAIEDFDNTEYHPNNPRSVEVYGREYSDSTMWPKLVINSQPRPTNLQPIIHSTSHTTERNTAFALTFSAYDPDGDQMTYNILKQPLHGRLSGTPPHMTYTPDSGYVGTDSLMFNVYDYASFTDAVMVYIQVEENRTTEIIKLYIDESDAVIGIGTPEAHTNWDDARTHSVAQYITTDTSPTYTLRSDMHAGVYRVYRLSLPVNTSSLAGKEIVRAKLHFTRQNWHGGIQAALTTHTPQAVGSINSSDFDITRFNTLQLLTGSVVTPGASSLTFELNQTGLQTLNTTGTTVFGLMTANDYLNNPIGVVHTGITLRSRNYPDSTDWPYLEVEVIAENQNPVVVYDTLTTKIYTTDDGDVSHTTTGNWATMRSASGGTNVHTTGTQTGAGISYAHGKYRNYRSFHVVDLSAIPSTAQILSASFNINIPRVDTRNGGDDGNDFIEVVASNHTLPLSVVNYSDIDVVNNTGVLSGSLDISSELVANQYNSFVFTQSGIDSLQAACGEQFMLSLREGHDSNNQALNPLPWAYSYIEYWNSREVGTDKDPYIEMTYLVPQTSSKTNTKPKPQTVATKVPTEYKLYHNYPNPFNPITTIKFDLPTRDRVDISIYNSLGQEVEKLVVDKTYEAGTYTIQWNTQQPQKLISTGLYFITLKTNNYFKTQKAILIK